nr:putative RNA-directed DNA polymerase, eukaryota, reverse transcriptase zinc-binding domain protein [Tanacetum cinerariifolium]
MVRDITDSEIKGALFFMGDEKAPGPDVFTTAFFKKAWNVVGKDVTCAIQKFFINGKLLKELNHTLISLIPKNGGVDNGRCYFYLLFGLCEWKYSWLVQRGHINYVHVIMQAFEDSKNMSDLVPSVPKSTAFFCNVPSVMKASIMSLMPFVKGFLLERISICKKSAKNQTISTQELKSKEKPNQKAV